MGAYLSMPVTEKVSNDEEGKCLAYGASSMQGWRVSQEDAHNSIIDFDENTHLFAVYDGHGGHEVAAYTALKLPDFIKKSDAYLKSTESLPECLKTSFLSFDETLVQSEVVDVLKQIAGTKDDESNSEEEEEVDNLYREATMPLDEVMAKYAENPHLSRLMKEKKGVSPFLRAKSEGSSSNSVEAIKYDEDDCLDVDSAQSSSSSSSSSCAVKEDNVECEKSSPTKKEASDSDQQNGSETQTSSKVNGSEVKHINGEINDKVVDKDSKKEEIKEGVTDDAKVKSDSDKEGNTNHSENGEVLVNGGEGQVIVGKGKGKSLKGGKGKALLKNSEIQAQKLAASKEKRRDAAVKAQELYRKIQDNGSEDELSDEDEEDDNFEDGVESGEVGEDSDEEEEEDDDDEDDEEDDDDDDDDDDDEEEEELDADDPYAEFAMNMKEEPGFDSGCTACLALIRGSELYVANVGDSRIVVCRDGKAVDMSIDHKPDDDPEAARIIAAGGRVTEDGRVNGGLNLSRAIGDHGYKQNKTLPPEEQMISPLPDVQSITLCSKDKFMIVACDGIWNSMSSQEACDFVSERLDDNTKISAICEELFDHCLAPNTLGDGTGCDNMTCIIVTFKDSFLSSCGSAKRTSEEAGNEDLKQDDKKLKSDADE